MKFIYAKLKKEFKNFVVVCCNLFHISKKKKNKLESATTFLILYCNSVYARGIAEKIQQWYM